MGLSTALQQTIYTALTADVPLMAAIVAVYDDVPQVADSGAASDFPFVTIGEDILRDWSTNTWSGAEALITIHTWSRLPGRKETKAIQDLIYTALHRATLTIAGHTSVLIDFQLSDSFLDPDGKTRHGTQDFRVKFYA